jgi:hypothetical protein
VARKLRKSFEMVFAETPVKTNQEINEPGFDARVGADHEIQQPQLDTATGVLRIVIPYTTLELTKAALRHAGVCTDLNVSVSLVDIQVVPFPCPLHQCPIDKEFSQRRLRDLFDQSGLPGSTNVLYARDWSEGFCRALEPDTLVVLTTKKRWWRTREEKLARALMKAGHQVMLVNT